MGTRSAIGVMHGDKVKAVYCHWDGYLSHNGKILLESYDSPKANHLVALGDLSSLGTDIGEKHEFDCPHKANTPEFLAWYEAKAKVCTFYGRDRGETDCEFKVFHNDQELFAGIDAEYFYVMRDGVWFVSEGAEWTLLSDAIAKEMAAA